MGGCDRRYMEETRESGMMDYGVTTTTPSLHYGPTGQVRLYLRLLTDSTLGTGVSLRTKVPKTQ